jgi:NADPH:quinone reductase-like Zn-dependent oxidoreductase
VPRYRVVKLTAGDTPADISVEQERLAPLDAEVVAATARTPDEIAAALQGADAAISIGPRFSAEVFPRLDSRFWLLVHAGAGGVGSAAIQLGKAAGAHVIATAGGPEKVQVCRDLGADHVVDYTAEDFVPVVKEVTGGDGADVVYDPVGGDVFDRSRKCIAFEGRLGLECHCRAALSTQRERGSTSSALSSRRCPTAKSPTSPSSAPGS